jgi:hypothetical protein
MARVRRSEERIVCVSVAVELRVLGSPRGYSEDKSQKVEWRLRTGAS